MNLKLIPFILNCYRTFQKLNYVPDYILHEYTGETGMSLTELAKIRDVVIAECVLPSA